MDGFIGITENLKKATTEMIILSLLENKDMHIYSITESFESMSDGAFSIAYPYAAIYRLLNSGYIIESGKRIDNNRRRQFYSITPEGKLYLSEVKKQYLAFTGGIAKIFEKLDNAEKNDAEQ